MNQANNLQYCQTHESHWSNTPECPWCQRDKILDEIKLIKETFQAAVNSKQQKGGQHVPYHGDFANITPSSIREMEWWIKRWNAVLNKFPEQDI